MAPKFAAWILLVIVVMAMSLGLIQEVSLSVSVKVTVTGSLNERTRPNLFIIKGGSLPLDTLACIGCSGNGSGYG